MQTAAAVKPKNESRIETGSCRTARSNLRGFAVKPAVSLESGLY
jgi:hypothetical protein